MESIRFEYNDFLACCGSTKFANEMASMSPFTNLDEAVHAARDIWFNKVDVSGWIEAFSAHPQIGQTPSSAHPTDMSAQWSKGEQSTALATGTATTLQELADWNAKYRQKFGFVFLICASGRGTLEILNELKRRYSNRPIVEFEIAAQEQMKITELRLAMLFSAKINAAAPVDQHSSTATAKAGDRMSIIGAHLAAASEKDPQPSTRTRPPVTTHVLDIGRGCPASGIEVRLEIWKGKQHPPSFADADFGSWMLLGSATTDRDGRSGQLMSAVDPKPGIYRISFDTGILAQMVVAVTYQVNLHCPECAHKIRKILVGVPEVHSVDVNFEKSEVKVVGSIDAKKIHDRIETLSKKKVETIKVEADFKETIIVEKIVKETKEPILHTTAVKVHMHCDQCEYDLRRKLLKHQGIYNVKTDMKSQSLTVDGTIEPDKLLAYIHKRVHKHAEIMSTKQARKEAKPEAKSKKDKEEKKITTIIEEKEENKEDAKMQERPTKVIDIKDVEEVEEKLKESNTPYVIHYVYAPQWFSDENPTSCSIM